MTMVSNGGSSGDSENSRNGGLVSKEDRWPPGFRFHPTDEELLLFYLKRKICRRRLKPDIIRDLDVYKYEPWDLPGKSLLQTGDKQWYFFSPRDRKYPKGGRSNRGTKCGYWKATGKDRSVLRHTRVVGTKKTLVFYNGRAPKGQRTDWVMHEYIIDNQEIKNCAAVQDSYALYKIYQKSGPGPKNGEQYGAPFREEEWLDDDHCDFNTLGNPATGENLSIEGAEKILQQMDDDLLANEVDFRGAEQVIGEARSAETIELWQPCDQANNAQTGFQIAETMSTLLLSPDLPEMNSLPHWLGQEPLEIDEDFMELNDLLGQELGVLSLDSNCNKQPSPLDQEPAIPSLDNSCNKYASLFDQGPGVLSLESISDKHPSLEKDGLHDSDIYYDAPWFLPEEFLTEGSASQPYFDSFSGIIDGQMYHGLPAFFDDESQYNSVGFTSQLWSHDDKFTAFSSAESRQVLTPSAAPGVLTESKPLNVNERTQMQGLSGKDDSQTWFTSTINSMLESIPTTPASASETALFSRTFQRMSSFGNVHIRTEETSVVATGMGTNAVRRESRSGGFLFLSCLGTLLAVFWVIVIGTMVKIFKAFFGRLVAS